MPSRIFPLRIVHVLGQLIPVLPITPLPTTNATANLDFALSYTLVCCLFCTTFCFLASIVCWAADCSFFFALFSSCLARLAARATSFSLSCSLLSFTVSVGLRTRFLFKTGGGDGDGVFPTQTHRSDCLCKLDKLDKSEPTDCEPPFLQETR